MRTCVAFLLLLLAATPLIGDDKNLSTIHGFIDGYYACNENSPDNHESFVPGTGTTGKRTNEFNLNLAAIDIVHDAGPVGFHFSAIAGNGADVVHAGEPRGSAIGPDVYRHFYQASIFYKATDRLTLEAGYGRYALDKRRAIAVRVERFRDPDNGISGTPRTLDEVTVTYEYRPVENLIVKLEGRRDRSTAPVFARGSDASRDETIAVVSAVVTFQKEITRVGSDFHRIDHRPLRRGDLVHARLRQGLRT